MGRFLKVSLLTVTSGFAFALLEPYPSREKKKLVGFLLLVCFRHVQSQPIRVQVQLVLAPRLLQDRRNVAGVLDPPQVHIAPGFLDRVANQFGRTCLSLRAHHRRLFFLARFVDHEGGALGFLLRHLLGFNCSGKFGGEGEML